MGARGIQKRCLQLPLLFVILLLLILLVLEDTHVSRLLMGEVSVQIVGSYETSHDYNKRDLGYREQMVNEGSPGDSSFTVFVPGESRHIADHPNNITTNHSTTIVTSQIKLRILMEPASPVGRDMYLCCMVPSAPAHFTQRETVRRSWGGRRFCGTTVFILGRSTSQSVQEALLQEHQNHGDFLMADFIDDYTNMTLKMRLAFHYAEHRWNDSRFVLKADDDIFINERNVLGHLKRLEKFNDSYISCHVYERARPIRNLTSKWYVSERLYPGSSYPDFCSGSAYIMSRGVVGLLSQHLGEVVNLPNTEDVVVTGLARSRQGHITLRHIQGGYRGLIAAPRHNPTTARQVARRVYFVHVKDPIHQPMWAKIMKSILKSKQPPVKVYNVNT